MKTYEHLFGKNVGRWTVLGIDTAAPKGRTYLKCRCKCGNESSIRASALTEGRSLSCGCLAAEISSIRESTHRMVATPEYWAWRQMKGRCYNKKDKGYSHYGGRGITICDRWRNSFENFLADMGRRPPGINGKRAAYSLDRIDNNGNYEPSNCRWATKLQQSLNKRDNHRLTFDGKTMCISEWERHLKCTRGLLRRRLFKGWTVERTLATPVNRVG